MSHATANTVHARNLDFLDFRRDRSAAGQDTPGAEARPDKAVVEAF